MARYHTKGLSVAQQRELIDNLLRPGTAAEQCKSSFRDFHVPGVNYYNLHRSPAFTLKLYEIPKATGFIVAPHGHGYSFHTWILKGELINVTFDETQAQVGPLYHRWNYRSKLRTDKPTEYSGPTYLAAQTGPVMRAGDGYYLHHSEVHTLMCPRDALLLLFQYADEPKEDTPLYTREPQLPALDGLYNAMTEQEYVIGLRRLLEDPF